MNRPDLLNSELSAAATTLEEELRRFEDSTESLCKTPLGSQKNLERAARTLTEVAAIDERLAAHVKRLVVAISAARERQQSQANQVEAQALQIQARTSLFQDLLQQYGALGTDAGALNALMQRLAEDHRENPTASESTQSALHFEELKARMDQVVNTAASLMTLAEERDFTDLARQADSLRQQLLAARNKMNLLQGKLGLNPQAQA